jgi:hypothetical protein
MRLDTIIARVSVLFSVKRDCQYLHQADMNGAVLALE